MIYICNIYIYIYISLYIYVYIYISYVYMYIYIYIYIYLIQVKKFPKVSLLCRKVVCSNSQSIQVQVYSLNLYYMNKFQSL